jgi:hypothetical protein
VTDDRETGPVPGDRAAGTAGRETDVMLSRPGRAADTQGSNTTFEAGDGKQLRCETNAQNADTSESAWAAARG